MRIFAAMTGILFSLTVLAAEPAPSPVSIYVEGKDYVILAEPLKTTGATKIEVIEAFAYPCDACFNFEPIFESWIKKQQPDVVIVRSPVSFHPTWTPYQRGYYTVQGLNLKEDINMDIFNAIHVQHKELNSAQAWADFLATYGVDKKTVIKKYDSLSVTSQIQQADARTADYKVDSTPTLIVEGKYKVSNHLSSYDEVLKVTQFLVDKVRAERVHH